MTVSWDDLNVQAPAAPTGVTATPLDGGAAVAWSAVTDPLVVGFTVTATDPGGMVRTYPAPASARTLSLGGLTNDTVYSVAVSAFSNVASSQPSTPASVTPVLAAPPGGTGPVAVLPGAPTLTGVTAGNGSLLAVWTAPASNGGSPLTGYRVTVTGPAAGSPPVAPVSYATAGPAATSVAVVGLTNGTSYVVTVAAVTSVGTGPESGARAATPLDTAPTQRPADLTGLVATPLNGGAAVSWVLGALNGGAFLRYTISAVSSADTLLYTVYAPVSAVQLDGLTNGLAYLVSVTVETDLAASATPASGTVTPLSSGATPGGTAYHPINKATSGTGATITLPPIYIAKEAFPVGKLFRPGNFLKLATDAGVL